MGAPAAAEVAVGAVGPAAVAVGPAVVVAVVVAAGFAPKRPPLGAVVAGAAVVDVLVAVVAAGFPMLKSEGAAAGVDEGVVEDVPPKVKRLF